MGITLLIFYPSHLAFFGFFVAVKCAIKNEHLIYHISMQYVAFSRAGRYEGSLCVDNEHYSESSFFLVLQTKFNGQAFSAVY